MSFWKEDLSPEYYAQDLLCKTGLDGVPIDVEGICTSLGIKVITNSRLKGEAYLLKSSRSSIICIKENTGYLSRRRFSIAHELGHYYLPWHEEKYLCSLDDINSYTSHKVGEKEANLFASEILMPKSLFIKDIKKDDITISSFKKLANKYDTSLIETALRYISNCDDYGALVFSKDNKIMWAYSSKQFYGKIRDNGPLSTFSIAYDFFTIIIRRKLSTREGYVEILGQIIMTNLITSLKKL